MMLFSVCVVSTFLPDIALVFSARIPLNCSGPYRFALDNNCVVEFHLIVLNYVS